MAQHPQWSSCVLFYTSPPKWQSWWYHFPPERAAARWSAITNAFYSGNGCFEPHGYQGFGWWSFQPLSAVQLESCNIESLSMLTMWYWASWSGQPFWEGFGAANQCAEQQCFPNSIQCTGSISDTVQELLPWEQLEFPCKYLGLPLTPKKLTKTQLQPYTERLSARLPGWKADLLSKEGRKILVQHVLTPMLIYLAMPLIYQGNRQDKKRFSVEWKERCKRWALSASLAQSMSS